MYIEVPATHNIKTGFFFLEYDDIQVPIVLYERRINNYNYSMAIIIKLLVLK